MSSLVGRAIRSKGTASVRRLRRLSPAEVGLLVTVVIWSLNFTLTKYVLEHGFQPLAWSGVRFTTAALVFAAITLALERSLRMSRRDLVLLFGAAVVGIWLNQIGFVYSLKFTTASTAALVFGTLPIFTIIVARASGVELLSKRFVAAAGVSFRESPSSRSARRARSQGARRESPWRCSARRRGRSTPSRSRR